MPKTQINTLRTTFAHLLAQETDHDRVLKLLVEYDRSKAQIEQDETDRLIGWALRQTAQPNG